MVMANYSSCLTWCLVLLLSAVASGCGSGRDPILGGGMGTGAVVQPAPTVTGVVPDNQAAGVPIDIAVVSVSFSEPMAPMTGASIFTLACAVPCTNPTGAVALSASRATAGFTLTAATRLTPLTLYTATVSGVRSSASGVALASPYVWRFTTAAAPDVTAPAVSATTPAANVTGIAINTLVTASFTEPMNPLTITAATFTLACPAGNAVAGTVAYAMNGNVATLTPTSPLPHGTVCTARINTGVTDVAGNAMASPFAWTFTTGVAPDTTAPTVSSISPGANATAVATNTLVTAGFSEPMDPLSIDNARFTLSCPGTPITSTVGYAVNGSLATLTPASALPASTVCSARITTGVTDVAHNPMAAAFSWTFTTGVAPDTTAPTIISTNPAAGAVGVCINKTVSEAFGEPMDPLSITTATFTLTTAGVPVTGVVVYDAQAQIATFDPATDLIGTPATQYTITIKGGGSGVKDLAGNALAADQVASFTTNASTCATVPALGAAAPFGGFGGSTTLTNDGLATVINGDIGVKAASSTITGLHDSAGSFYTVTLYNNGLVNGLVYTLTAPTGSVAGDAVTHAHADALLAFNAISPANLAGGINVANLAQCPSCGGVGGGADELAGRTLPPGVYLSATGAFDIGGAGRTAASLTLDAGGDTSAVWIFQTTPGTGSLNVGLTGPTTPAVPIQVLLINGAQSKNIFWYVPAGAVIGTGSTVAGTLLADAAITMSTTGGAPPTAVTTTINGRAIALTAGVTMTNTVINVPAP